MSSWMLSTITSRGWSTAKSRIASSAGTIGVAPASHAPWHRNSSGLASPPSAAQPLRRPHERKAHLGDQRLPGLALGAQVRGDPARCAHAVVAVDEQAADAVLELRADPVL